MSDLAKIRSDHAELVKTIRRLADAVAQPAPPAQVELFNLRRELSSTLVAHLKLEDWALYPRLIDSGDAAVAATARRFNNEMGGLAADFAAYSEQWTAQGIQADWPGYCAATRAMVAALSGRITRENRELLPLLDGLDQAA